MVNKEIILILFCSVLCLGVSEYLAIGQSCWSDEFSCINRSCVTRRWVCEGVPVCRDGIEETGCPPLRCPSRPAFNCAPRNVTSTICITRSMVCDRTAHCPDRSDEKNCSKVALSGCSSSDFACSDGQTCIVRRWVCDGVQDCPGGGDEIPELCRTFVCNHNEFQCKTKGCIARSFFCNGLVDCPDRSDEENCGAVVRCDEQGVFDCGGGHCIAMDAVCDGKSDCPDSEDEPRGQCGVNECLVNNGNCSQTCVDTLLSSHCACLEGYKLGSDNRTCDDIDECDIPGSCSQICHNEIGTFRCECEGGYLIDIVDNRRCKAAVGNVSLILVSRGNIFKVSLENQQRSLLVNGDKFTREYDFNYRTDDIFWRDFNKIYRTAINGENRTTELKNEIKTIADVLAVDWIYNHIYWTEGGWVGKMIIGVANLDGSMRKSLITERLHKPTAIVVNPLEGWLFWSEVNSIVRAGLDGTNRETIVWGDDNTSTWSLALDLVQRRIYWADRLLHYIASCNYDGSGRREIVHNVRDILPGGLSIAVFEDYLYWTQRVIFRANKFNGRDVTKLDLDAHSVKVYHPYTQPDGVNHCGPDNGNCSHLCLPAPQVNQHSPKTTCACPDGLNLTLGGFKCAD